MMVLLRADGPVMNVFWRETAVMVLLAADGPVMNGFWTKQLK